MAEMPIKIGLSIEVDEAAVQRVRDAEDRVEETHRAFQEAARNAVEAIYALRRSLNVERSPAESEEVQKDG